MYKPTMRGILPDESAMKLFDCEFHRPCTMHRRLLYSPRIRKVNLKYLQYFHLSLIDLVYAPEFKTRVFN